jgi:hypothetical protein
MVHPTDPHSCFSAAAHREYREAEAAVIEAAKRQADAGRRWETHSCDSYEGGQCAHEINYERACNDTDFAVTTLRALEGDA